MVTWWQACHCQACLGMAGLKSAVPVLEMAVVNLSSRRVSCCQCGLVCRSV